METMQWSEVSSAAARSLERSDLGSLGLRNDGTNGSLGAPTIKNHSVTYFNDHLYCFGGYDGRRNHNLLLLYNIREHRWIRPQSVEDDFHSRNTSDGTTTSTNQSNTATSELELDSSPGRSICDEEMGEDAEDQGDSDAERPMDESNSLDRLGSASNNGVNLEQRDQSQEESLANQQQRPYFNSNSYNPSPRINGNENFNSNMDSSGNDESRYPYTVTGNPPPGRNGHSATLATDDDDDDDDDLASNAQEGYNGRRRGGNITGRIIILGGWLGQGPLAASDMHVLEIARGGKRLRWYQPAVKGTPPGPCNMHSADYVKARKEVFVFRGGNGREYLNDVHALHVPTMTWRKVETTGESPQQRANHSSCILEETGEIFIFGGWNGTNRLNDIYIFDTKTCNWSCPKVGGILPHPRAGMTLTALRGRLYLFGGSGTSSKCFQDLQIFDREEMAWLDVTAYETVPHGNNNNNGNNHTHHQSNTIHPPNYFQGQFALPQSQPYYVHPHQHQQYQNPFPSLPENGFYPSNPQWNFNGQQHHDSTGGNDQIYHRSPTISNPNTSMSGVSDGPAHARVLSRYHRHDDEGASIHRRAGSFRSSRADWTSRELAATPRSIGTGVIASPNPNDEDTAPTVIIQGLRVPGSRAGHTATAVNRKIYVFGGSCGSDYLNDFYVLDTDPPPRATVTEATSSHLIKRRLPHFFNDEEFSDVTFLVQGRKVYGHKMVLAIVSDCFRAMFTAGFRESSSSEIEITGCSYESFLTVMEYIYTGATPNFGIRYPSNDDCLCRRQLSEVVDVLELADRFFLDHLKQICETFLQSSVRADTVDYLLQIAQKTNALQLQAICEHVLRNHDSE